MVDGPVSDQPEDGLSPGEALEQELERAGILSLAIEVERDLTTNKNAPLRMVLDQARDDALDALRKLIKADPHDAALIRELQWDVGRYEALNKYVKAILDAGHEALADLNDEDAEAFVQDVEDMVNSEP